MIFIRLRNRYEYQNLTDINTILSHKIHHSIRILYSLLFGAIFEIAHSHTISRRCAYIGRSYFKEEEEEVGRIYSCSALDDLHNLRIVDSPIELFTESQALV